MAGQTTRPYKATLSGSIGAGMGSVFNPGGRKYFILEHKVSSKYHHAGEAQEIIVDQIEIGRDSHCQVRFDDSFSTVSRHHAAIVKDGDNWKLVQISKTNTTLLNGRPVHTEWYLQNGDEIQLSVNGPKLGFIVPTGKKATVGSIGLTRRLSLFRQQALRPYKQAIAALATVLFLAVGVGGYVIFLQNEQLKDNSKQLAEAKEANEKNEKLIAEQQKALSQQAGLLDSLKKIKPRAVYVRPKPNPGPPNGVDMSMCFPYVFFIEATPYVNGEAIDGLSWIGTGFQLNDGKFVTARHVTTPYFSNNYYIADGEVHVRNNANPVQVYYELMLNILFQQGKAEIVYKCTSTKGSFQFRSSQVSELGKYDEIHTLQTPYQLREKGENGQVKVVAEVPAGAMIRLGRLGALDFAFYNNNITDGLMANRKLSEDLKQGTQLHILGYPHGLGKGNPIYSTAVCAQNGLNDDLGKVIVASNDNTEGGNSGGPIFIKTNEGKWEIVAIVSGGTFAKGRFVPIAVIP